MQETYGASAFALNALFLAAAVAAIVAIEERYRIQADKGLPLIRYFAQVRIQNSPGELTKATICEVFSYRPFVLLTVAFLCLYVAFFILLTNIALYFKYALEIRQVAVFRLIGIAVGDE